jgi:hypothetical protein
VPAGASGTEGGVPGGLAVATGPPDEGVERVPLAGTVRVTAALGEEPRHLVGGVPGLVAELLGEGVVDVDVGEFVTVEAVRRTDLQQAADEVDDLVDGLHRTDVLARRDDRQGLHVGAEEVDLGGPQVAPVHAVTLGSFEQRIVDVGDVLHEVDPVPVVEQGPVDQVEGHVGRRVAEVRRVIGGDPADVDPHLPGRPVGADRPHDVIGGVVQGQWNPVPGQGGDFRERP